MTHLLGKDERDLLVIVCNDCDRKFPISKDRISELEKKAGI